MTFVCAIAVMQLRFALFAVINLRWDLHPQECARAGRNRVGDGVTPVALSHHRTCGSASGGSLNTLESSHRIEQRHQT